VLELVGELGIAKVVHTSTLSVFSDTHGEVVDETYRFSGTHLTDYDRMRARAHYEVALPLMERGLPGVILLPGAMYGPHDSSVMAGLLGRYLLGRVQVVSAGAAYCWAHVADVAQAHLLAMEFGRVGEQYIVGGEPHTVREVLAEAGRLVGRQRPPIPVPPWAVRPVAAVMRAAAAIVPPWRPVADRLRVAAGVTYLGDDAKARAELGSPRAKSEGPPTPPVACGTCSTRRRPVAVARRRHRSPARRRAIPRSAARKNPTQGGSLADDTARDRLTQDEAKARAGQISNVAYRLDLDLEAGAKTFRGDVTIGFDHRGGDTFLEWLGGQVHLMEVNGERVEPVTAGSRILLAGSRLSDHNEIRIVYERAYDHTGEGLHQFIDPSDGAEYLYTQLEPYSAHR
jgi:hypothetical protein